MTENVRRVLTILVVAATAIQIIAAARAGVLWPVERWIGAW